MVDKIEGDRGSRDDRGLEKRLGRLSGLANDATPGDLVVFSGSSGVVDLAARERAALEAEFPGAAIRGYGGMTGHAMEAQFRWGWRLRR